MIKSVLILVQTNVKSEYSLTVHGRIVTQERTLLGEKIIFGLDVIKEVARFCDSVSNRAGMLQITQDLRKTVRSAYKENMEKKTMKKIRKGKRLEKGRSVWEGTRGERKCDTNMESLANSEEDWYEQDTKARRDLEAANELLNDARSKLDNALSSTPLNKKASQFLTLC